MTDFYAAYAAELHRIADDLNALAGRGLAAAYVSIDIHPHRAEGTDEQITAEVDAVATALLGRPGETYRLSGGSYHHGARNDCEPVRVAVYNSVSDPDTRQRNAELAALRAELAALRDTPVGVAV